MTDDDKISLFVALLGCGTARACANDLPRLLTLPPSKVMNTWKVQFHSGPDLKSALLGMFKNIREGQADKWRSLIANKLRPAIEFDESAIKLDLKVTFEIDANHVRIDLVASLPWEDLKEDAQISFDNRMEFGLPRVTAIPGYSRRFHEISYERLVGWGTCLSEDVSS